MNQNENNYLTRQQMLQMIWANIPVIPAIRWTPPEIKPADNWSLLTKQHFFYNSSNVITKLTSLSLIK